MTKLLDAVGALSLALAEGPLFAKELKAEMLRLDADPDYIQGAAKYLRDSGVIVIAERRRHLSQWYIAEAGSAEVRAWEEQVRATHFSERVSQARALYPAARKSRAIARVRDRIVGDAWRLVEAEHSMEEVIEMCRPIHKAGI